MTPQEQAWVVKECLAGRKQTDIAIELCVSPAVVCSAVKRFCDDWSGADVSATLTYNDDRLRVALVALRNYFFQTDGSIYVPSFAQRSIDQEYQWARKEHAWLLRAEGLTYRAIGERLGISMGRAREHVGRFGRRCRRVRMRIAR